MVVNLQSPDGTFDRDYLSNYALTQVRDRLARSMAWVTCSSSVRATMPCASGSIRAAPPSST
jgi:hypothetical protein